MNELKTMSAEELETRKAEIREAVEVEDADLDALEEEARAISEELESRKAAEAKRAEIRANVAAGAGVVTEKIEKEERQVPTLNEIRESRDYINAFANYIKTNDDAECRKLLSTNAEQDGQVPVPTFVEGRIRTAWEKNGLMNLVKKTYIRGNIKIGFELSATGAEIHKEGANPPTEEELTFGVISLVPESIKKWIRISDEAMDMGGEEFLSYIYDELTYRIAKKACEVLLDKITGAPAVSDATHAAVPTMSGASNDLAVVAKAISLLSDDASDPVVVMNKQTRADFVAKMASNGYKFDPFEGIEVHYNNGLKAFSDASSGDCWMIVGDFYYGAQANFPNGDEIRIKYDDLSEAEYDLVKLVGREYVAIEVVSPNAFVTVTKA